MKASLKHGTADGRLSWKLIINLILALGVSDVATANSGEFVISDGGVSHHFILSEEEALLQSDKETETEQTIQSIPSDATISKKGSRSFLLKSPNRFGGTANRRNIFKTKRERSRLLPVLYPVNTPKTDAFRRYATPQLRLRFNSYEAAAALANELGCSFWQATSRYFVFEFQNGLEALDTAAVLKSRGFDAEPMLQRQRTKRWVPNDPYFNQQWHLKNSGQSGGIAGIDLNIIPAWDLSKGDGSIIAIVDDGLQTAHPDLAPNTPPVSSNLHIDVQTYDNDPNPGVAEDVHGTSVAGLAAGKGNNSLGITGTAPNAQLIGVRLIGDAVSDQQEAAALGWNTNSIHIFSNSWGPFDGAGIDGPDPLTAAALEKGAREGRGGRGAIYVFAGGNGNGYSDNANFDGYANSIYTIAVGACTDQGTQAQYSESGANLHVSAPSSGGYGKVVTTDRTASAGYNPGFAEISDTNYTQTFGGTSASAPMVSGVVGLMLSANPSLGWRDIQAILIRTAKKISPNDPDWANNSAGIHFNHKFGAGLVDAYAAVNTAKTWTNMASESILQIPQNNLNVVIPDNNTTGISRSFDFATQPNLKVEHVEVKLDIAHAARSDLEITLTSPSGMKSVLAPFRERPASYTGDNNLNYQNWTFTSVRHWGENSSGVWKVQMRDLKTGTAGTLRSAVVTLHGTTVSTPATQISVQTSITSISEGGATAKITFTRSGWMNSWLQVRYTLSGTAANGSDYSLPVVATIPASVASTSITLTPLDDSDAETVENISLQIQASPDYQIGSPSTVNITIADNDKPKVTIVATDSEAAETGLDKGMFTIQRNGPTVAALNVQLSIGGGCIAGQDYQALPSQVTIPQGSSSVSVYVTPIENNIPQSANTVTISAVANTQYAAGDPSSATVYLLDNDPLPETQKPSVTITYPASNAKIGNLPLFAQGTSSDNQGVARVEYQVNNSGWRTARETTSWSADISALVSPGLNFLKIRSTDVAGNVSTIIERSFTYVLLQPLNVSVQGTGVVTQGFPGTTSREVGKNYSITAKPTGGMVFNGWSGTFQSSSPTLQFAMPNTPVNLQANFIPNPFTPLAGKYNGLAQPDVFSFEESGLVSFTLSPKGAFSAQLFMGATHYVFKGVFTGNGQWSGNIPRKNLPPLQVTLQLTMENSSAENVTGTISESGTIKSRIRGIHAVYNAKTNPAPLAGKYSFVLPPGNVSESDVPQGIGFGTLLIDKTGRARWTATLGDGTKASQVTYIGNNGTLPLYSRIYSGKGVITGPLEFQSPVEISHFESSLDWHKPMRSKDRYFPAGFETQAALTGSPIPSDTSLVRRTDSTTSIHADMSFDGGNLDLPFERQVMIDAANRVMVVNIGSEKLTVHIKTSGYFHGKFIHPVSGKSTVFQGVLLHDNNSLWGGGYFAGTLPSYNTDALLTGSVVFESAP